MNLIGSSSTDPLSLSLNEGARCPDKWKQFPPRWTSFLITCADLLSGTRQVDINYVYQCLCVIRIKVVI